MYEISSLLMKVQESEESVLNPLRVIERSMHVDVEERSGYTKKNYLNKLEGKTRKRWIRSLEALLTISGGYEDERYGRL